MQFIHPFWLLGLLAVAIPLIIHLFNFRRHKRFYFTNLKFLRAVRKETRKHQRLRHLLILISRILAIAFLVLAFAQPYIPGPRGLARTDAAKISIYVDNSMSMGATTGGHSLLDDALSRARELAFAHAASDRFRLITNDFEGRHQVWYNRDEFASLLEEVRVSPKVRSTTGVMQRIQELSDVADDAPQRLYILSDFQQSSTEPEALATDTTVYVFLMPMLAEGLSNVYIDSCWMSIPFNHLGRQQEITVRIRNASNINLEKIPLRLDIEGRQRALAGFDVAAGQHTDVQLAFTNREAGEQLAKLSIDDYPISWDDAFYLSWQVKDRIPVMVVSNGEAGYYLQSIFGRDSVFTYRPGDISRLVYSDFRLTDLVVLDNVAVLSSGLSSELVSFVEEGGSLFLSLAENADIESINPFLAVMQAGQLAPPDTSLLQVTGLNTEHELYSGVFESIPGNLDLPFARTHYPLSGYGSATASVIMELQNADPYISMSRYGKGRFYLLAGSLGEAYGNLVQHALWVPLVYRMAMLSRPVETLFYTVGKDVSVTTGETLKNDDHSFLLGLVGSNYEFIPGLRKRAAYTDLFLYDQLRQDGHYQLTASGQQKGIFAFNYDRVESDPAIYDRKYLEEWIKGAGRTNIFLMDDGEVPVEQLVDRFEKGRELWRLCVWLALFFILAETALIRFWRR